MKGKTMAKRSHDLKTWTEPFTAVWDGRKTYEVRKNDRDYRVGDELVLREWLGYSPDECCYSGRVVYARVEYMTRGGTFGLPADLCVMSLHVLSVEPIASPT